MNSKMSSKMSSKMCCSCLIVSLITLVLVCVLVYQSFKPQVDGFDNHSTKPVIRRTRPVDPNQEMKMAQRFMGMCMSTSDMKSCCDMLDENKKNMLPQCK